MRKSALFIITALSGAIALGAHAGPLGGGLVGGIGGGLGGSLGSPLGGLNGSLSGRLSDPDIQADRAAAEARAKARQAKADAQRAAKIQAAQPGVSTSFNANAAVPRTSVIQTTTRTLGREVHVVENATPRVIAAAPVVGLPAVQTQIIRERQGAALYGGGVTVLSEPDSYVYMDRQAEDLRRALTGTGISVRREGETIVLEMPSDVTFAFNKSDIRPRFYAALEAVARTLNQYPATYVDVIGHTDAIGSAAYNQALSERRADSVAGFIEQRERIPARFYVAGRGKFEPIASNATIEGRAANRRVEILLQPYVGG